MINSVLYLSRFIGMVEGIGFHGIKTVRESNNKLKDQASKVSAEWENLFFFFFLFFPLNKLSYKSVYALLDKVLCIT